jgi:hypothetical protein
MRRSHLLLVALPLSLSIAACGATPPSQPQVTSSPSAAAVSVSPGSAAPSGAPSTLPSGDASAAPSGAPSSAAPSASPSAGPSATPTSAPTASLTALDPCVLVTRSEAGRLARLTVGAGKEATVDTRRYCTYAGAGTLVTVIVAQAPSLALLNEAKSAVLADLQAAAGNGLKTTRVSGIGDAATLFTGTSGSGSAHVDVIAIHVVKGLTFFAITETTLAHTVATAQAIETQARTTANRVP